MYITGVMEVFITNLYHGSEKPYPPWDSTELAVARKLATWPEFTSCCLHLLSSQLPVAELKERDAIPADSLPFLLLGNDDP